MKGGVTYLINGKTSDKAFSIFTDQVMHGMPGLCITRCYPDTIREKYNFENTPLVWLSRKTAENDTTIQPTGLPHINLLIRRFLDDVDESVILLEGLEYLITQNNFNMVLKLIQTLNDEIMTCNCRLVIPVDFDAIEERNLAMLKRDLIEL